MGDIVKAYRDTWRVVDVVAFVGLTAITPFNGTAPAPLSIMTLFRERPCSLASARPVIQILFSQHGG